MLLILLASWLALARAATVGPKDNGAEVPPPPPAEDFLQKEIDPLEDLLFQFPLQEKVDSSMSPMGRVEVVIPPVLIRGEPQVGFFAPFPRGWMPLGAGCIQGFPCGGYPPDPSDLAEFPPGRPTLSNIENICAEERQKTPYGPWNLPYSGSGYLSRQGQVLNDLEGSLSQCCQLPKDEKLNCSQAAWSDALEKFCEDEVSVKTSHYHCCRVEGASKEGCFASSAPFPNYDRVSAKTQQGEKPSNCLPGDPSKCKPQDLVISFPPGRPTDANIRNICNLRKFRPVYLASSLPKTGFGWFVRQARAINRLENAFKKCCRKEDVGCAHRGWEKTLTRFCKQEGSVKTKPHFCCKEPQGKDRFACFANHAPFPAYNKEGQVVNLAEVTPSLLDLVCGRVALLSKQKHVPALVQNMTRPCCQLRGDERTKCAQQEKSQFLTTLCNSPKAFWKDTKKCCSHAEEAARIACFESSYLSNVALTSPGQLLLPT